MAINKHLATVLAACQSVAETTGNDPITFDHMCTILAAVGSDPNARRALLQLVLDGEAIAERVGAMVTDAKADGVPITPSVATGAKRASIAVHAGHQEIPVVKP